MIKLALFLLGCICFAAASDVLVLTEADYASTLKENSNVFVEFYAPWCGHCKALAPEYEKLATALKGKVPIAKVDCTTEQNVCSQEGIQGYPTIKFFKNGNAISYNGEREAEAMQSWILKKSGDGFTLISSQDAENDLIAAGPAVIAHFSNKDSDLFKQFNEIAQLTEDVGFGAVFDSSAVSDFKADSVKAVVGGQTFHFDGSDLAAWIADYGFPLVDKLNQKGFERFVKAGKKYFVLLFAPQVDPKETVKVLEGVAADYRKDLGFLWDLGEQYAQHASKLGFSGDKFPVIVAMSEKEKFFPMGETQEYNADNIKAFFDNLLAGKVEAHAQSEAIPESNDGPVKIVVGKNFDELVTKSSNDVFLEVYAPWCGHCKSLAPVWDKLGERLAGKSVTVAKVDATANDIPVNVQGFPTLLYFKAGSSEPIAYEGGRDLESLLNFVKEQSSQLKDEL